MSAASLYKKAVTPDIPGASLCHWYYPCDDILSCGFCLIRGGAWIIPLLNKWSFFLTCFSENWLSELFEKSIMTLKNKPFKDGWITKGFYLNYCNITLPPPPQGKKKGKSITMEKVFRNCNFISPAWVSPFNNISCIVSKRIVIFYTLIIFYLLTVMPTIHVRL